MGTGGRARRAAGTTTPGDVLLRLVGVRRRTAEGDRADLDAGRTLLVAAFSKSIGGEVLIPVGKGRTIARLRVGRLHLSARTAPVWVERGRKGITLVAPLALEGEGEKVPTSRKLARYTLATGAGTYDVVIPRQDAELVRYALSTVRVSE